MLMPFFSVIFYSLNIIALKSINALKSLKFEIIYLYVILTSCGQNFRIQKVSF